MKNPRNSNAAQVKQEKEEESWDIYFWKQKTYGDFFDQVAELENLTPLADEDSFIDLKAGQGTQGLLEGVQSCLPSSPWPSFTGSGDKESTDDSVRYEGGNSESGGVSKPKIDCCQKILDKRLRNNQASKKFRQLRKDRQKALFDLLQALENENYELNVLMEKMIHEINHLKAAMR